ncbi:MAG: hypothetical protein V4677_01520 [Bacteroidota bacterium]
MHKRDYLVKQFEEFGKVIAVLLGLKRDGNYPDFLSLIDESAKKYTATEIEFVESIHTERLIITLTEEQKLNDEQLKMLADLLYEKAEYYVYASNEPAATNCYRKSLCIYLFLKDNATLTYSLDMHYKIEVLSNMGL